MIDALADAVAADPSNDEAWAIYADYLLEVDPVVGERIALELALAKASSELPFRWQIMDHEIRYPDALSGPKLAKLLPAFEATGLVQLDRRFGMILGAIVQAPHESMGLGSPGPVVRALIDSPAAQVMGSLVVYVADPAMFVAVVNAILDHRPLALRRLYLGTASGKAKLQTLLERVPRLDQLALHGQFKGPGSHERLRRLELSTQYGQRWGLSGWRLPALETLRIEGPGPDDWRRVELPKLRRLELTESNPDLATNGLATSDWLPQLVSLQLNGRAFPHRNARMLLTHPEQFGAIGRVTLFDAPIQLGQEVTRALPNVELRSSSDDTGHSLDQLLRWRSD